MDRDAQLNELIRLKQLPPAPVERWQMVATRPTPKHQPQLPGRSPARLGFNSPNTSIRKTCGECESTAESNRLVVKYKKTPKVRRGGTPSKTPAPSTKKKSPPKSGKKRTPARTGQTPGACRFIPNR